ncbi:hypothetical protein Syun_018040 [Stephania yunnanensis]|uniref:Mechanosensitive ion channel MscS domain-containing protein n=1 Tax=Stephania yunnanensis TaxID=152371 RepID=A0AAP0ISZ1_9MAGN
MDASVLISLLYVSHALETTRMFEWYIEEEDLLRFLRWEEIDTIFPLFEGAIEAGHISKSRFRKLGVIGVATTKVLLVVSSQLVLVGFMFQNTCKTIFESIVFVFVMHPFDVGDRCVIDDVQMIVEEMNILTTVFLRYDNEKIVYSNSTLSTKPISNFYRSPEMSDTVDFTIDVSTFVDNINALEKQIQAYIESKPKHWNPKHSLLVKEIENVDKMKLTLSVLHTINHQNYGEKNIRRSELVLELKKIFENIGIKYHVLPQEIHLTQISTPTLS